jgi:hypothetical protein
MASLSFKFPDAATDAALPPVPTNLFVLSRSEVVAALIQYAAQSGHAGGLGNLSPFNADDIDFYGPTLRRAALRATGDDASPVPVAPVSSPTKIPGSTAFTPAARKPPRLLLSHPAAEAAADGAAAPSARATPTVKQITENIAQAAAAQNALAHISKIFHTFPRTLKANRERLVGAGVTLDVAGLRELPAHLLAQVAFALNTSWHAGHAARRAILQAAPAGGTGGARLAAMLSSATSWDTALAGAVRSLPDPPRPTGAPSELFLALVDLPIGRLTLAVIAAETVHVTGGAQNRLERAAEALVVARGGRLVLEGLPELQAAAETADESGEDIDFKAAMRPVIRKLLEARDVPFRYDAGPHDHTWAQLVRDTYKQWLAVESRRAAEMSFDGVRGVLDDLSLVARELAQLESAMDRLGHDAGRALAVAPALAPMPSPAAAPAPETAPAPAAPSPPLDAALLGQITQIVASAFAAHAAGASGRGGGGRPRPRAPAAPRRRPAPPAPPPSREMPGTSPSKPPCYRHPSSPPPMRQGPPPRSTPPFGPPSPT